MRVWGWMQQAFAWSPLGQVIANWQPLTELFASIWELIKVFSVPFFDFLKTAFDWSPLGMIVKNWAPISQWFKDLWAEISPILEPMMSFFGGGKDGPGMIQTAKNKVDGWTAEQRDKNAGVRGGDGSLLMTGAAQNARNLQAARNQTQGGGLAPQSLLTAPSLNQQAAANDRTNLEGALVMRFENSPPGLQVESSKTNQPGLQVKAQVGRRSLSQ